MYRALLLLLVLCPSRARAETLYAGVQGCSDSGPGTQAQPFCSPTKAAAKLKPGDTLTLLGGTYNEQLRLPASASGTADKHVVIQGAPGAAVVLDGSKLTLDDEGVVQGTGLAYLELRNFTIKSSPFYCLLLSRVNGVVLEAVTVDGCKHGGLVIDGPSTNLRVQKCEIKGTDACGKDCGTHEALTLSNVVGFVVTGNKIHDGVKEGITIKDGSGEGEVYDNEIFKMQQVGLYLLHAYRVQIHHNKIHDNGSSGVQLAVGDFATGIPETTACELYRNEIWNNGLAGVQFWRTFLGEVAGNRVFNNTIVGNKLAGLYMEDARFNTIANNILARNTQNAIFGTAIGYNTITTNLFFENGSGPGESQWDNPVRGDPLFLDEAKLDFRLRKGSPAIDTGIYVGLKDAVGQPDIGAHEYKEGETPAAPGDEGCSFAGAPTTSSAGGLATLLLFVGIGALSARGRRRVARRAPRHPSRALG